ncbi:unnamed protein product [Litomosoides sigmodontis]|uniref:Uncharacterized protein n=1 Tax=Litomosoides sigmodontis TaxID=42156 RepID=A0A3P6SPW8_LITSI|nr:unnamed protein product [Litomosoides sigmodontis]
MFITFALNLETIVLTTIRMFGSVPNDMWSGESAACFVWWEGRVFVDALVGLGSSSWKCGRSVTDRLVIR